MAFRRLLALGLGMGACGSRHSGASGDGEASGESSSSADSDTGTASGSDTSDNTGSEAEDGVESSTDGGPPPDLPPGCETPQSGILWFTTFADARLFSFRPGTGDVEFVDFLPCLDPDGLGPYATTVDREGTIWGYLWDTGLVEIDPVALDCAPAPFVPGPDAYQVMSLGFVAPPGSTEEKLYATFAQGENLEGSLHFFGTIDTPSGEPTILGPLGGPDGIDGMGTPLTTLALDGLGDGRLYGMISGFDLEPYPVATVVEVDPVDGALVWEHPFPGNTSGWPVGFSWWGSDLYLVGNYYAKHGIFRWDPESDDVTTVVEDIRVATGIDSIGLVAGVGSSSCLPLPP